MKALIAAKLSTQLSCGSILGTKIATRLPESRKYPVVDLVLLPQVDFAEDVGNCCTYTHIC